MRPSSWRMFMCLLLSLVLMTVVSSVETVCEDLEMAETAAYLEAKQKLAKAVKAAGKGAGKGEEGKTKDG